MGERDMVELQRAIKAIDVLLSAVNTIRYDGTNWGQGRYVMDGIQYEDLLSAVVVVQQEVRRLQAIEAAAQAKVERRERQLRKAYIIAFNRTMNTLDDAHAIRMAEAIIKGIASDDDCDLFTEMATGVRIPD